jgi:hypothetical protein
LRARPLQVRETKKEFEEFKELQEFEERSQGAGGQVSVKRAKGKSGE